MYLELLLTVKDVIVLVCKKMRKVKLTIKQFSGVRVKDKDNKGSLGTISGYSGQYIFDIYYKILLC